MKKVILALSVIGLMTACGSSNETEVSKNDSTTVVTTTVVVTDSVKVGSTDTTVSTVK